MYIKIIFNFSPRNFLRYLAAKIGRNSFKGVSIILIFDMYSLAIPLFISLILKEAVRGVNPNPLNIKNESKNLRFLFL